MLSQACPYCAAETRVGGDLGAQRALGDRPCGDDGGIGERIEPALAVLDGVLDVEQQRLGNTRLLGAARGEGREQPAQLRIVEQVARQGDVALEGELGDRVQPAGLPRIARGEGELARPHVARRIAQEIRRRIERAAVGIDAQIRHVEDVARKLVVIEIAAERRDGEFRREHEAHVEIAAVAVELEDRAAVERDDVAADRSIAALAFAGDRGLGRLFGLGAGVAARGRRSHRRCAR